MVELSANAKRLLKHFQDRKLHIADYEYPKIMRDLFGDDAAAAAAQAELEEVRLLERGSRRPAYEATAVKAAALTREGARHLAAYPIE
jgi:hypothetical protein